MIENILIGKVGSVKFIGKNLRIKFARPKSNFDNKPKQKVIIIKPRNVALAAYVQQIESEIFLSQPSRKVFK